MILLTEFTRRLQQNIAEICDAIASLEREPGDPFDRNAHNAGISSEKLPVHLIVDFFVELYRF